MKKKMMYVTSVATSVLLPVATFATEPTGTANADVVNAMTTAAADMTATGRAIIPVALTVIGLALAVKFGIKMFKGIVNK